MLVFVAEDPAKRFQLQVHKFVENFSKQPEDFLTPAELEHLAAMDSQKRRSEFVQSRFVLKTELSKIIGTVPSQIEFITVGEGKPQLSNFLGRMDFNLSHSGDFFAVVFSEQGQVGVDIEKIRKPHQLRVLARRFFSQQEVELIEAEEGSAKQAEIFTRLWSGKEALVKCVGGGVFRHVHEVLIDEKNWCVKRLPAEFGELKNWELNYYKNIPEYICSVAFKAG